MKAVVVRSAGAPETMTLEDLPLPALGRRDVLVKVEACGVCMHDAVTRAGIFRYKVAMPLVPGHEVCGTVAGVGDAVSTFAVGDRVASTQSRSICGHCGYCRSGGETHCSEREFLGDAGLNGGYAEYAAISEDGLARVPEGIDAPGAAIAACAIGTVYRAIVPVGRVQPGQTVLVTGSGGGLGIHAVQLARLAGARVIALTTSPAKAKEIAAHGAHVVLTAERGEDFSARVRQETGGRGADVVIDTVGTAVFHPTRRSLAPRSRWVLVGQLTGDFVAFNPAQLFLHEISLLSAKGTSRRELESVLTLIRDGDVRPVVSRLLPLAGAGEAHARIERGEPVGRIVLQMD